MWQFLMFRTYFFSKEAISNKKFACNWQSSVRKRQKLQDFHYRDKRRRSKYFPPSPYFNTNPTPQSFPGHWATEKIKNFPRRLESAWRWWIRKFWETKILNTSLICTRIALFEYRRACIWNGKTERFIDKRSQRDKG